MYELATTLFILNKNLMSAMQVVSYLRCTVPLLTDVHTGVTCLTSRIISSKENVDALYKYLKVLGSHKVNSFIVPPVDLHNIVVKVKHDMRKKPQAEITR